MINVFVKRGFSNTWEPYLHDWGGARYGFRLHMYEDLCDLRSLPPGPLIFSDIERLTAQDRLLAADVERVITGERPEVPILNSPTRTRRRYDLLAELYELEFNPFRAYRLTDTTTPNHFPVFLRYENDHAGAATGLLRNQRELDRAIVRAQLRLHDLRELIVVEFVDTASDKGLFAKYGAYKVGEAIVPRGINISEDWVVKNRVSIRNSETSAVAHVYVQSNPHEDQLKTRFDAGRVDYGRIDYSMLGNTLITWEINTNPTIMDPRLETPEETLPRQRLFLSLLGEAFENVCPEGLDPEPLSLAAVSPQLRSGSRSQSEVSRSPLRSLGRRHKRWLEPAVRVAETVSIPFSRQIVDRWQRSVRY